MTEKWKFWISWAKYKNWHFSIWSCRYFLAVSQCASGLICSRYPSPWHPIYQEIWACQIPSRLRHFSIFIALFAPTRPNVQKVRTPCCVDIRRAFYGRLGDIRSWTYDKCQNQILDIFYIFHHQLPSLRGDSQSPFLEVGGPKAKKEGKRVTSPSFGILTRGKTAAKPQNKVILHWHTPRRNRKTFCKLVERNSWTRRQDDWEILLAFPGLTVEWGEAKR